MELTVGKGTASQKEVMIHFVSNEKLILSFPTPSCNSPHPSCGREMLVLILIPFSLARGNYTNVKRVRDKNQDLCVSCLVSLSIHKESALSVVLSNRI